MLTWSVIDLILCPELRLLCNVMDSLFNQLATEERQYVYFSNYRTCIYISGLVTAVAVLRNPNTIPFCLTTDLLLNVLFSWLLVHLPSTFFLDVLFFFFPLVSTP